MPLAAQLVFEFPAWMFILCLLAGFICAAALYFRDKTFIDPSPAVKRMIWVMASLRFLAVTLISFLLLAPLLRSRIIDEEKPVVVILQDQSLSVRNALQRDSAAYVSALTGLKKDLSGKYDVKLVGFGSQVKETDFPVFGEKYTNISEALEETGRLFYGRNLGAVILATDGIYNQGVNPLYSNSRFSAPVYVIPLGDTAIHHDLMLSGVGHNRIAYLGDKIGMKADIEAANAAGRNSVLDVYHLEGGSKEKVFSKPFSISGNRYHESIPVILDADEAGLRHYRLELSVLEQEMNTVNNVQDIFIEVIDGRQQILILASSPHPDLSAFKQAIEANDNYEAEIQYLSRFQSASAGKYNLAILHQVPSVRYPAENIIDALREREIPVFYVLGIQTATGTLNRVQGLVAIEGGGQQPNEITLHLNESFSLFTLPENTAEAVRALPPLTAPFGRYKTAVNSSVLGYQKIGSLVTDFPALVFNQGESRKIGIMAGEGFWQWRLYDYKMNGNHGITDQMLNKIVQYLSVKADKRQFRVTLASNILDENQGISMDAELYNDSYEPVNGPDVQVTISDEEGKEYPFVFGRARNGYHLDAGHFPVGNYTFLARTSLGTVPLEHTGSFSVTPVRLEEMKTVADHAMLNLLAGKHGGEMVYPTGMPLLGDKIRNREDIKPLIYSSFNTNPFINLKWICLLLIGLLGMEWFARKYSGAY